MRFSPLLQTLLLLTTTTTILAAPHPLHSTITHLTNNLPTEAPHILTDATLPNLNPLEPPADSGIISEDPDKEAKNWLSSVFSSFTGLFKKKPAPKPKITTADVGAPTFVGSSLGW